MEIEVIEGNSNPDRSKIKKAFLIKDAWNDWYTYYTMYTLAYVDSDSELNYIGSVKIGEKGLTNGRPSLPDHFDQLSNNFFSIGQSDTYYEELNNLGDDLRNDILSALNDMAYNNDCYLNAKGENVLHSSLLRNVSAISVTGQFRRLSRGGVKLSRYRFSYRIPQYEPVDLTFNVKPMSNPPTNVHTIIGRNGVGKTHLINNMIKTILNQGDDDDVLSEALPGMFFEDQTQTINSCEIFANLVLVSFSAFDRSQLPEKRTSKSRGIKYSYIGLKHTDATGKALLPKTPDELSKEFADSAYVCNKLSKERWSKAIETLETDPFFRAYDISKLKEIQKESQFKSHAIEIFIALSSGHKIVLLTMTRLIETVEERSLVLIDEPENHLHPPLLSAFIRALSDLLINRNAVAIIATHSPVILQEVPKSCVWILRGGMSRTMAADRPIIETFGENIGALTREVFKLEVENSGFHKMLQEAVDENDDYEDILNLFSGQLGNEAKAIVRTLFAIKE